MGGMDRRGFIGRLCGAAGALASLPLLRRREAEPEPPREFPGSSTVIESEGGWAHYGADVAAGDSLYICSGETLTYSGQP